MTARGQPGTEVPTTLPRGRHKLPRKVVRASQRERLLQAMLELVAERGYAAVTVPDVVATAMVGRNAFYELFADKTACFLAVCDRLADQILGLLWVSEATDWIEALQIGSRRYLRWWQDNPEFAQAYLVEMPAAGHPALEAREKLHDRIRPVFEQLAAWARREQPDLPPVRPRVLVFIVPALEELVAREVRNGHMDGLTDLEDDIVFLTAKLLADEPSAVRALER